MSRFTLKLLAFALVAMLALPVLAAPNPTLEPTYAVRVTVDGASLALANKVLQTRPQIGDEITIQGRHYRVTRVRINYDSPTIEGAGQLAARVPLEVTVSPL